MRRTRRVISAALSLPTALAWLTAPPLLAQPVEAPAAPPPADAVVEGADGPGDDATEDEERDASTSAPPGPAEQAERLDALEGEVAKLKGELAEAVSTQRAQEEAIEALEDRSARPVSDAAAFGAHEAHEQVQQQLQDLEMPETPAAVLLGIAPTAVVKPESQTEFTAALLPLFQQGDIGAGFALQVAPAKLLATEDLTIRQWQEQGEGAWGFLLPAVDSLNLSIAAYPDVTSPEGDLRGAVGARFTAYDSGDYRRNAAYIQCVEAALAVDDDDDDDDDDGDDDDDDDDDEGSGPALSGPVVTGRSAKDFPGLVACAPRHLDAHRFRLAMAGAASGSSSRTGDRLTFGLARGWAAIEYSYREHKVGDTLGGGVIANVGATVPGEDPTRWTLDFAMQGSVERRVATSFGAVPVRLGIEGFLSAAPGTPAPTPSLPTVTMGVVGTAGVVLSNGALAGLALQAKSTDGAWEVAVLTNVGWSLITDVLAVPGA